MNAHVVRPYEVPTDDEVTDFLGKEAERLYNPSRKDLIEVVESYLLPEMKRQGAELSMILDEYREARLNPATSDEEMYSVVAKRVQHSIRFLRLRAAIHTLDSLKD